MQPREGELTQGIIPSVFSLYIEGWKCKKAGKFVGKKQLENVSQMVGL